jgi:S-adenosyl-L-methionine hydrolase (adenosine-forming)
LTAIPGGDYFHSCMRDRRRGSSVIDYAAAPVAPRVADRPIVTLTTDFGLSDHYVAAMKAVLIRECPAARLIDVTHAVPRHDILCASITLERAIDGFPKDTVHLAVVDPGVGTDRRLLIAKIKDQFVVAPDNGLITWAWRVHAITPGESAARPRISSLEVAEITRTFKGASSTFHGRDILAPIAGMLARGVPMSELTRPIDNPVLLDNLVPARCDDSRGAIIHIDHFGNATTNIRQDALRAKPAVNVRVNRRTIGKLKRTYWDVAPGKPLALIGSSGLLEIAVRDGSAHDDLKVRVGDEVVLQ